MGNHDPRRDALPLGSEGREAFSVAEERTQDGETTLLLPRNIHADEGMLELSAGGETYVLGIGSKSRQHFGADC